MRPHVSIVVAVATPLNVISIDGKIPWNIPEDRKFFANLTWVKSENILIMGKLTYESMAHLSRQRNGKTRRFYVVSSTLDPVMLMPGDAIFGSYASAYNAAARADTTRADTTRADTAIFAVGGENIYLEALEHPATTEIFLSQVVDSAILQSVNNLMYEEKYVDDEGFPVKSLKDSIKVFPIKEYQKHYEHIVIGEIYNVTQVAKVDINTPLQSEISGDLIVQNRRYIRKFDEIKYLTLLETLVETEGALSNRTGIPTRSVFAEMLKFDLSYNSKPILPVLTTKFVPIKTVFAELLWFLRGDTNTKFLKECGVKIWDGNTSREYLDDHGFGNYPEGELGPGYGFQWRNFNGKYEIGKNEINQDKVNGYDQISALVESLRKDPMSRRHVLTAWNPAQLHMMALPPCHIMAIFMVTVEYGLTADSNYILNCHLTMRSADLFLGVPFNIASYALLTHMLAQQTGMVAGQLAITMVNCHLYENHVAAAKEQLQEIAFGFPQLDLKKADDIFSYMVDSLKLINYFPGKKITAPMAI